MRRGLLIVAVVTRLLERLRPGQRRRQRWRLLWPISLRQTSSDVYSVHDPHPGP